jgi:predicted metal-binding membrane protein
VADPVVPAQEPGSAFFGVSGLLFLASAGATVSWCNAMAGMDAMAMPGGWTMPMAWMRMPGETWAGATASFVGMWLVMMAAMMLPSLIPALWRYHQEIRRSGERRPGMPTALVGLGYFSVWTVFGLAVYPLGLAIAAIEMEQPALAREAPLAAGLLVFIAGLLQFTPWKARHLMSCRRAPERNCTLSPRRNGAWRRGVGLGMQCTLSCANLTSVLLVLGVMDLRTMIVVTAAITSERLAPGGATIARIIGAFFAGAGLVLIARAAALG